jgi:hypothetical protein
MLSKKSKVAVLIASVLFFLILKYVADHIAEPPSQILQFIAYVSQAVAGGLIVLSFCSLLGTFAVVQNSATSHVLGRVSEGPGRNFFLGFFIVAYLILARPPLASNVPFLPYVEWVVIALVVYVAYSMTRLSTDEFYVSSEIPSWKRHIQDGRRETGRDLVRVTSVMERFVNDGMKEPLLVYLTLHLQRLGETAEDILKILSPLINYQKETRRHKLYFLIFPWTKRKIAIRNKKARGVLLNTLFEKIDEL